MSVAAVVVTYNRLTDLEKCLTALRMQSQKADEIIVIDNGSTDGTREYLLEIPDVTTVRQGNDGGAGGFSTGLKAAFAKGHDWVWLMDDDCLPARTSLESLAMVAERIGSIYPVLNSHCIRQLAPDMETFDSLPAGDAIDYSGAAFFNGTMVGKEAFRTIGNVNRDLIIWGDEVNFFMRARNKYGRIPVARDSVVLHPPAVEFAAAPSWKQYFGVRNSVYNALRHSRFGWIGVFWVLWIYGTKVLRGELGLNIFLRASCAGLAGKLGWDNPFFGNPH